MSAEGGGKGHLEGLVTSQLWGYGSFTRKFFENIGANVCYMVHFLGKICILNNSVFNLDFGRSN